MCAVCSRLLCLIYVMELPQTPTETKNLNKNTVPLTPHFNGGAPKTEIPKIYERKIDYNSLLYFKLLKLNIYISKGKTTYTHFLLDALECYVH